MNFNYIKNYPLQKNIIIIKQFKTRTGGNNWSFLFCSNAKRICCETCDPVAIK